MKTTYKFNNDYYDCTEDLTSALQITRATLSRWVQLAKLPLPLKLGNRNYYNRRLVQEYLRRAIPVQ